MLVHDGNLQVLGKVAHGNGRVDWVVVVIDSHLGFQSEVRTVILDALLHLKAVRVSVEGILVVEASEAPLSNDFSSLVVNERDLKHLNFKFDWLGAFTEANQSLVDCHVLAISVDNGELASQASCMHLD